MSKKKITIIGCGPGSKDYLTPIAKNTALQMEVLAGASRLFELFPEFLGEKIVYKGTAELINKIEHSTKKMGVLVSGDTTYFSLAQSVVEYFGIDNCELIPGISSIQVALSHFGLKSNTTKVISAHAGIPNINPNLLSNEENIILLGGNSESTDWILSLISVTSQTHTVSICIDLTLDTEQIITLKNPTSDIIQPYLKYSRIIFIFHSYS